MPYSDSFTVTEEHIKLLYGAVVSWDGSCFGAPGIYSKKPYGNSDVYADMAKILDIEGLKGEFWDEDIARMEKLHKELEKVLEILLHNTEVGITPGLYKRDDKYNHGSRWYKAVET
jgi:hypothetical protein